MKDATAVRLAAGRVRRGDVLGALGLLERQGRVGCGCLSFLDLLDGLSCPHRVPVGEALRASAPSGSPS